jgi:hypothetical protein
MRWRLNSSMRERGAARKAKVHVEAQDVRVVGKHLQDHRAAGRATCHLRNARDPGDRRFDKLRRRGRVIERGFKPQHAAVGGDQHEVRRVLFQLVRVSLTPRLRLLIFRDGDVEQDSEPDRGADQGIGKMRNGAGRQDQEADAHQTIFTRLGSQTRRRRLPDARDFPAEQAKIGLAPTRLRQRLQEFQRLQRIGR